MRDGDSDATPPRKGANLATAVTLVDVNALGAARTRTLDRPLIEQRLEHRRIVLLSGRQRQRQQLAVTLGADLPLGAETAAAQGFGLGVLPVCTSGVLMRSHNGAFDKVDAPIDLARSQFSSSARRCIATQFVFL